MATLDEFWNELLKGLEELVQTHLRDYKDEALAGAKSFLETSEGDIKKYTNLYATGAIDKDDYYWLLKSRLDLVKLHTLTEVGLAQVRLEHFRIAFIDFTVGTAFNLFKSVV